MLFTSIEFFLFLPLTFALYWLLRKKLRWQNLLVVGASYLFYGWWDWRFLLLIAFTTLCCYDTLNFYNATHLNRRGAEQFSIKLAHDIILLKNDL